MYTITNVSLSKSVATFGDTVNITLTATNNSTVTARSLTVYIDNGTDSPWIGDALASIAPGETKTATFPVLLEYVELPGTGRATNNFSFRLGSDSFAPPTPLTVYYEYLPRIDLDAYRVESVDETRFSDEGTHIYADIALNIQRPGAGVDLSGFSAKLTVVNVENDTVVFEKALPRSEYMGMGVAGAAQMETGEADPYLAGYAYDIFVEFGDRYEYVSKKLTIPQTFANVHLSGASTGGVCFGGFSTAKEGIPKFECRYPATFFENVYKDVGGTAVPLGGVTYDLASKVSTEQLTADLWLDGQKIYRRYCTLDPHASGTQTQEVADISTWGANVSVVNLRGMLYSAAGFKGNAYPLPYAHYTAAQEVALYVENDVVKTYAYGSTRTWASGYVVVEYVRDAGQGDTKIKFPTAAATAASPKFTASSEYSSSYAVWKAFDNNIGTSWASKSPDGANAWIQYELPQALSDIDVFVYGRKSNTVCYPKSGVIELSNDGATWTQGATFANWAQTSAGGLLGTVNCGNDTAYKYVRLRCTEIGGNYDIISIGYMQVQGYAQE